MYKMKEKNATISAGSTIAHLIGFVIGTPNTERGVTQWKISFLFIILTKDETIKVVRAYAILNRHNLIWEHNSGRRRPNFSFIRNVKKIKTCQQFWRHVFITTRLCCVYSCFLAWRRVIRDDLRCNAGILQNYILCFQCLKLPIYCLC